jgi:3-oxoacyl-[acyl-carrier protein] reductase
MQSLSGKVAVVTGGTRGIGRAIAERLLEDGASVAICGRTSDSVERAAGELRRGGEIFGYPADVTREEEVRKFFQAVDSRFGGMDILVNNAGAGVFKKVADLTVEDWHRTIDLNLTGVFYCCREALPRFHARGGGFIVNISSLAGKNAFSGGAAYNASKSGLNLFSEALMLDHRYDNVRVSYVMPGSVDTDFSGPGSGRSGDAGWMISAGDVAEIVATVLRMPSRTTVSRVEIRPSRPKK